MQAYVLYNSDKVTNRQAMEAAHESQSAVTEQYTVKLNASVALKLASIGQQSPQGITTGPIYGFDGVESNIISVTHTIAFPSSAQFGSSNNDDFFNLRTSNQKFQQEYLSKLKASNYTANLLGWFVISSGGKFISQSLADSLYQLQETFRSNKSEIPSLLVVYDPLKSVDGFLNLKCYKLSDAFLKTIQSDGKFIAKNLIENKLSYKNIIEPLALTIKSNHLTNLKIQEFNLDDASNELDNLSIGPSTYEYIKLTTDQLSDSVHQLNHNLGNLNYFQRNLSREIAKITKWEQKVKQDNEDKLKANPKAKLANTDWRKEFKLMRPSSKFDYLVASGSVNNICNNLQVTENIEYVKAVGIDKSI